MSPSAHETKQSKQRETQASKHASKRVRVREEGGGALGTADAAWPRYLQLGGSTALKRIPHTCSRCAATLLAPSWRWPAFLSEHADGTTRAEQRLRGACIWAFQHAPAGRTAAPVAPEGACAPAGRPIRPCDRTCASRVAGNAGHGAHERVDARADLAGRARADARRRRHPLHPAPLPPRARLLGESAGALP